MDLLEEAVTTTQIDTAIIVAMIEEVITMIVPNTVGRMTGAETTAGTGTKGGDRRPLREVEADKASGKEARADLSCPAAESSTSSSLQIWMMRRQVTTR
jgi:hypothetical protein